MKVTTESFNEATVLRASKLVAVAAVPKPCSPRAQFEYEDTEAARVLLTRFNRRELLDIPAKTLLQARNELYSEARAARGLRGAL